MSLCFKKKRLVECILKWAAECHTRIDSSHSLRTKCEGMDYQTLLEGMTADQLQFVLSLVAGTNVKASSESREYWSPAFHSFREYVAARFSQKTVMKLHAEANKRRQVGG